MAGASSAVYRQARGEQDQSIAQWAAKRRIQANEAASAKFKQLFTHLELDPEDNNQRLLRFSILGNETQQLVITTWIEEAIGSRSVLEIQKVNEASALVVAMACKPAKGNANIRLKTPLTPTTTLKGGGRIDQLFVEAVLSADGNDLEFDVNALHTKLKTISCRPTQEEPTEWKLKIEKRFDNVQIYTVPLAQLGPRPTPRDPLAHERKQNEAFGAEPEPDDFYDEFATPVDEPRETALLPLPGSEGEYKEIQMLTVILQALGFEVMPWELERTDARWFYAPRANKITFATPYREFKLSDYTKLYLWARQNPDEAKTIKAKHSSTDQKSWREWLKKWYEDTRENVVVPESLEELLTFGASVPIEVEPEVEVEEASAESNPSAQADDANINIFGDNGPLAGSGNMDTTAAIVQVDVQNATDE